VKNLFDVIYSLYQVLVLLLTISDWPSFLVGISIYSKSSSPKEAPGNVPEYFLGRISWNLPWLALTKRLVLPSKQVWGRKRLCQQIMTQH